MERETQLTKEYLKAMGNKYDLEIIHVLDLSRLGVRSLGALVDCSNLAVLDLSRNQLRAIKGLESLAKLRTLNLSYNQINNIEPLRMLNDLEDLQLQDNKLETYQCLEPLKRLPKLLYLHLQEYNQTAQNPLCKADKYRRVMLDTFASLFSLDGHRRHNPVLELDEKSKEILARGAENPLGEGKGEAGGPWISKEDLDPSSAFASAKSAGGHIVVEIEGAIRDAEKTLKDYDKFIDA